MAVKRIVANIATPEIGKARAFYADVLGLDLVMDLGWIQTFAGDGSACVQISVMSEGGSETPVPDISIEVDDFEVILARLGGAGIALEYGPVNEPWGVRRCFVRDPFGRLVNILVHSG